MSNSTPISNIFCRPYYGANWCPKATDFPNQTTFSTPVGCSYPVSTCKVTPGSKAAKDYKQSLQYKPDKLDPTKFFYSKPQRVIVTMADLNNPTGDCINTGLSPNTNGLSTFNDAINHQMDYCSRDGQYKEYKKGFKITGWLNPYLIDQKLTPGEYKNGHMIIKNPIRDTIKNVDITDVKVPIYDNTDSTIIVDMFKFPKNVQPKPGWGGKLINQGFKLQLYKAGGGTPKEVTVGPPLARDVTKYGVYTYEAPPNTDLAALKQFDNRCGKLYFNYQKSKGLWSHKGPKVDIIKITPTTVTIDQKANWGIAVPGDEFRIWYWDGNRQCQVYAVDGIVLADHPDLLQKKAQIDQFMAGAVDKIAQLLTDIHTATAVTTNVTSAHPTSIDCDYVETGQTFGPVSDPSQLYTAFPYNKATIYNNSNADINFGGMVTGNRSYGEPYICFSQGCQAIASGKGVSLASILPLALYAGITQETASKAGTCSLFRKTISTQLAKCSGATAKCVVNIPINFYLGVWTSCQKINTNVLDSWVQFRVDTMFTAASLQDAANGNVETSIKVTLVKNTAAKYEIDVTEDLQFDVSPKNYTDALTNCEKKTAAAKKRMYIIIGVVAAVVILGLIILALVLFR